MRAQLLTGLQSLSPSRSQTTKNLCITLDSRGELLRQLIYQFLQIHRTLTLQPCRLIGALLPLAGMPSHTLRVNLSGIAASVPILLWSLHTWCWMGVTATAS